MGACSAAGGGAASPGPGRAGFLKKSQIPYPDPIPRSHSQIRSQILRRGHFLFENRSLIDFQRGNGHVCRPGAYSSFGYRVVVDFQRVNEQVGALLTQMTIFQDGLAPTLAPTGWCGLSGDLIFSTQRIFAIGRSDFLYTKNSARLRYDCIYTKSCLRKIVKNQYIL